MTYICIFFLAIVLLNIKIMRMQTPMATQQYVLDCEVQIRFVVLSKTKTLKNVNIGDY